MAVRSVELDHIFICVTPGAPEASRLIDLGFIEGTPSRHPGQGTANRRFFFRNSMLELIWVDDEREARSPQTARTNLYGRWNRRGDGACPFGLCSRPSPGAATDAPFEGWEYRPKYLPPPLAIDIADDGGGVMEPMLFHLGFGKRPDASIATPRNLDAVRLTMPNAAGASAQLASFCDALGVSLVPGPAFKLELTFDAEAAGVSADLEPELPLVLRW